MRDGRGEREAGAVLKQSPALALRPSPVQSCSSASCHFSPEPGDKSSSKQTALCENTALICNLSQKQWRRLACRSHLSHKL